MDLERERAVWARVGGKPAETQDDRLLRLYMTEMHGTYLFLYLASRHFALSNLLRQIAGLKMQSAERSNALYFFRTGRRLLAPPAGLPVSYSLPEVLRESCKELEENLQMLSQEDTYADLLPITKAQRELLVQIVSRKL